jgi:hypothetical protein
MFPGREWVVGSRGSEKGKKGLFAMCEGSDQNQTGLCDFRQGGLH